MCYAKLSLLLEIFLYKIPAHIHACHWDRLFLRVMRKIVVIWTKQVKLLKRRVKKGYDHCTNITLSVLLFYAYQTKKKTRHQTIVYNMFNMHTCVESKQRKKKLLNRTRVTHISLSIVESVMGLAIAGETHSTTRLVKRTLYGRNKRNEKKQK